MHIHTTYGYFCGHILVLHCDKNQYLKREEKNDEFNCNKLLIVQYFKNSLQNQSIIFHYDSLFISDFKY